MRVPWLGIVALIVASCGGQRARSRDARPPQSEGAPAAPAPSPADSGARDTAWTRFRDAQIRVALEVPPKWILTTSKPYGMDVNFQADSSGNPYFDFGRYEPRSASGYTSFPAWIRDEAGYLASMGKVTARRELTVGGLPAAQIETNASFPKPQYLVYTFIGEPDTMAGPQGGVVFQFVMSAHDEARAREYRTTHDRIVASIQILPEP